jgi:cytochrome b561
MGSQLVPPQLNSPAKKPGPRVNSAFKQLWSMHWWMAGFYLLLFTSGTSMVRMPEDTAFQENAYTLHKSIGALTMAFLTWRILILQRVWWRKYTRRLPKVNHEWIRAVLFHCAIYIFMLVVPLSGFFLSNSYQSGNVPFFWLTLPDLFPKNSAVVDLARSLHFWLAYTFLGFVVLHGIEQRKYMRALWRRANNAFRKSVT